MTSASEVTWKSIERIQNGESYEQLMGERRSTRGQTRIS